MALALALPLASAHSTLQAAEPSPNGHASWGLSLVNITFTEDVEREYTSADVVDILKGESWAAGPITFDDARHSVVHLPTKPLVDGIYSVSWRTLSVDTHTARGTFVFSVGNATLKYAAAPEGHDHSEHSTNSILQEGAARGIFYAGLFLTLGMPVFVLLVDRAHSPARRVLGTAALFGVLGTVAAFLSLLFFAQRAQILLSEAAATMGGGSILWRGILLGAASLVLALACILPPGSRRTAAAVAVLLAVGSLMETSLGSHAAALKDARAFSIAVDALHLTMGALWIGGVFAFVLVGRDRDTQELGGMVARFTPLAITSVVLLLATGTWASLRHLPHVANLWNDSYGRLISLKVLLLAPLIGLGYLNKEKIGPKLKSGAGGERYFRRVVTAEAIVMVLILSAAGILAASPPPDAAVQSAVQGAPSVLELQNFTKTTHVILQVMPAPVTAGDVQRIAIQLHPLTPGGIPNSTQIALKIAGPGEPEPELLLSPNKVGPADWSTDANAFFTSKGSWTIYLILQRPDEYTKIAFTIPVQAPGGARNATAPGS